MQTVFFTSCRLIDLYSFSFIKISTSRYTEWSPVSQLFVMIFSAALLIGSRKSTRRSAKCMSMYCETSLYLPLNDVTFRAEKTSHLISSSDGSKFRELVGCSCSKNVFNSYKCRSSTNRSFLLISINWMACLRNGLLTRISWFTIVWHNATTWSQISVPILLFVMSSCGRDLDALDDVGTYVLAVKYLRHWFQKFCSPIKCSHKHFTLSSNGTRQPLQMAFVNNNIVSSELDLRFRHTKNPESGCKISKKALTGVCSPIKRNFVVVIGWLFVICWMLLT